MKKAFTLAETVITIAIIGIIAAIAIPPVLSHFEIKRKVSWLKKHVSTLQDALSLAVAENGDINTWDITNNDEENVLKFVEIIKPYLKLQDDCGTDTCEDYSNGAWYRLDGYSSDGTNFYSSKYYKLRLIDGTNLFIDISTDIFQDYDGKKYPAIANIFMDFNGKKEPNTLGKDIFQLIASKDNRIIPPNYGSTSHMGYQATAWLYLYENMDYLYCPDELIWDVKTSCN